MSKKSLIVKSVIYSYLALPFIIFAAGFLKWYFAVPVTAAIIASVVLAVKNSSLGELPSLSEHAFLKAAFGSVLIILIVLLSGIGNVFWQNNDHATRNTIFDMLVSESWPVKYHLPDKGEFSLIYYIGFWLPSAVVGKLFSLSAGYVFQIIWACAALFIVWYLLCVIRKKIVIYPLLVFLFFSGLDAVGHAVISHFVDNPTSLQAGSWAFTHGSALSTHIEWWARSFQYSSHITQLFWVFNQCLPAWLATLVLLMEKNNKNLVFIMGLTLLSSPFPFVGLIFVFLWCALTNKNSNSILNRSFTTRFKAEFFSLFTFQNVVGGGFSGILSFLYLRGNIASSMSGTASSAASGASRFNPASFFFVIFLWIAVFVALSDFSRFTPSKLLFLLPSLPLAFLAAKASAADFRYYLIFVILEFGLLSLIMLPAQKTSSLFFISFAFLLIIPFFKVGRSIDFCMRASIPFLVIMSLFACDSLRTYFVQKKYVLFSLLAAILLVGAITPLHEVVRSVEATAYEITSKGSVQNDSKPVSNIQKGKNFSGSTKNNLFFDVFAK